MKRYCTRCAAEITAALEAPYWADGKKGIRTICLLCERARKNALHAQKKAAQKAPEVTAPVPKPAMTRRVSRHRVLARQAPQVGRLSRSHAVADR